MAREAVASEYPSNRGFPDVERGQLSAAATLAKGTFMKYSSDENVMAASTGTGDVFAGFLTEGKSSTDSINLDVGAEHNGVYELTCSGAVAFGQKVKTAAPGNYIMACTNADITSSYAVAMGVSLATGSDAESIRVRVF